MLHNGSKGMCALRIRIMLIRITNARIPRSAVGIKLNTMNIRDLLHKRVLVAEKDNSWNSNKTVKELKILEVSPSGNWVKTMDMDGRKYWKHYSDITPVEILETLNPDKPSAGK